MNKIPLNIAGLDGGVIIKKGGGGGVTINNQEKSLEITENGVTEVTADAEFTGLSKVSVNVAIPNEQKTVDITENGRTEIVAEEGFLSKAIVNVNVPITGEVVSKDVNFYDYDGTLLYSYTWDEAVALTELPPLPKQKGLICQEWNYTLDDIKAQTHHMADVGATYTTDDGRTRLYLKIDTDIIPELRISYHTTENAEIEFDWGDGSPVDSFTTSSPTKGEIAHQYAEKGEYVISIYSSSPYFSLPCATDNNNNNCFSKSDASVSTWLRRVEMAHSPNINRGHSLSYSFYNFPLLEAVTLCAGRWGDRLNTTFSTCDSLEFIVFPRGVTKTPNAIFYCSNLKFVSWPNSVVDVGNTRGPIAERMVFPENVTTSGVGNDLTFVRVLAVPPKMTYFSEATSFDRLKELRLSNTATKVADYVARSAKLLEYVEIPDSVETIGAYAFYGTNMRRCVLPKGLTAIGAGAFNYSGIEKISIPSGVSNIPTKTFNQCKFLREVSFIEHVAVPTLGNADAFASSRDDLKIIVPVSLYNEWVSATNWSEVAKYIVMDYTPQECIDLSIKADNVDGNFTSTTIYWTAITKGVDSHGVQYEGVVLTGETISDEFPQNTSEADAIVRTAEFEYMGLKASTQFTHKPFINWRIECVYNVTSTSSTTLIYSSAWSSIKKYIQAIYVDGNEISLNYYHMFDTIGEHEVIIDFKNDATVTGLYQMFYNVTQLVEVNMKLDMSNVPSSGTAYMFQCYNSNLRSITLPSTLKYFGSSMFDGCKNVTSLTVLAKNAPYVESNALSSSYGYLGANNKSQGINKLYVPKDAKGYDGGRWSQYIYSTSYCGFTKVEIDEQ